MAQTPARRPRTSVEAVKRLIVGTPSAPHHLRDLATDVGVSPFHLARIFRADTGESPHQYLLRIRMDRALSRLSLGESDLSRLAHDLGFSSHSHFSTVFRRHFGDTPARVRASLVMRRSAVASG
jgi:AraC-like DNA-binding protein